MCDPLNSQKNKQISNVPNAVIVRKTKSLDFLEKTKRKAVDMNKI